MRWLREAAGYLAEAVGLVALMFFIFGALSLVSFMTGAVL